MDEEKYEGEVEKVDESDECPDSCLCYADEPAQGKVQIVEEMDRQNEWYERAKHMRIDQLGAFVSELVNNYSHDYGTICHACAAAALAAAHAIDHSPEGGITGFQAGAIMWEFIQNWMGLKGKPLRLLEYENMLYPQYKEYFTEISPGTWEWLQERAKEKMEESGPHSEYPANDHVIKHWENIIAGKVPFGMKIKGD